MSVLYNRGRRQIKSAPKTRRSPPRQCQTARKRTYVKNLRLYRPTHQGRTVEYTFSQQQSSADCKRAKGVPMEFSPATRTMWYCHNPRDMQPHIAGPWLCLHCPTCQDCGHVRCASCITELAPEFWIVAGENVGGGVQADSQQIVE
jgi:hypothetical protein